MFNCFAE